jgi:hypothetical protein
MDDRYNHAPNDSPRSGSSKKVTPVVWGRDHRYHRGDRDLVCDEGISSAKLIGAAQNTRSILRNNCFFAALPSR